MKQIWGSILHFIARFIDVVLGGLITGLAFITEIVTNIRSLLMSCCFGAFIIIIWNPFSLLLFSHPAIWITVLFIFAFPLLGTKFVSFLQYWKYVLAEYLYDKADYYRLGRNFGKKFSAYGEFYEEQRRNEEYQRIKEEQEKREQARRRQQEEWERIFREYTMGGFGGFYGGGYQGGGYQNGNQQFGGNANYGGYNPFNDFSKKYKESCDALGLTYDTDEYQVKLAYRKLAKKYHPDINKSPDATEKFQKINDAYEFLSEENIKRYKQMNR